MRKYERDYYAILGVSPDAAAKEITDAYRKLAMQFHPDVNPSDEARKRMPLINEAYAVLGDAKERRMYDTHFVPVPTQSRLVVQRAGASVSVTRCMDVILDGSVLGRIRIGEAMSFLVTPGKHKLQVKLDMTSSRVHHFSCEAGTTVGFACGARSVMEYIFRSVSDPKKALLIQKIL